jgi:hypothetical protein
MMLLYLRLASSLVLACFCLFDHEDDMMVVGGGRTVKKGAGRGGGWPRWLGTYTHTHVAEPQIQI